MKRLILLLMLLTAVSADSFGAVLKVYQNGSVAVDDWSFNAVPPMVQYVGRGIYEARLETSNGTLISSAIFDVEQTNFFEQAQPNFNLTFVSLNFAKDATVLKVFRNKKLVLTQLLQLCNKNGKCDGFESYLTCADCPSASPDRFCDKVVDGKCDPDCVSDWDFDCTCGNGFCEVEERGVCPADCGNCGNNFCDSGERQSCPTDCPCGNGVCEVGEIATCPRDCGKCGDGVCEFSETTGCAKDCAVTTTCGNGKCEVNETKNCPTDCLCGNNICDKGEETSCVNDCKGVWEVEEPDRSPLMKTIGIILVLFAAVTVAYLIKKEYNKPL